MAETLGKRIAEHRKRLGLTQDALAEKLGITAQAVSKWENDLSCPDITMLPKLAEIFKANEIRSITVVRMQVPCCGGLPFAVKTALEDSGKTIPCRVVIISPDGTVIGEQ